jgi:hypothetical protein
MDSNSTIDSIENFTRPVGGHLDIIENFRLYSENVVVPEEVIINNLPPIIHGGRRIFDSVEAGSSLVSTSDTLSQIIQATSTGPLI